MHLNPKSKSIRWRTAGPAISKDLTLVALGLILLPLAATDPGAWWGWPLPDFSSARLYDNTALTSQSSRSEEATEVESFPGIRCHTQNTPLLPLLKTCGFFPWILHILPPLPSPANRTLFLWCIINLCSVDVLELSAFSASLFCSTLQTSLLWPKSPLLR